MTAQQGEETFVYFLGLFSESLDPSLIPHVSAAGATSIDFRIHYSWALLKHIGFTHRRSNKHTLFVCLDICGRGGTLDSLTASVQYKLNC